MPPSDLISQLQAKDGMLTVTAPGPSLRAAYRRAINRAITERLVPDGYVLRHQGRDRGDLVIRLLPRDEAEPEREHLPPIPLPDSLQGAHPAVRELRDHRPDLLDVGEDSRHRALLMLQAIAHECQRRGYEFGLRADGEPTFQVTVDGAVFGFVLSEEYERREVPEPRELATARYEWQRIPSLVRQVRSGRLVMRLGGPRSTIFWADRKRWTLVDKLPFLFRHVELAAQKIAAQRAEAEVRRQERRQAWEQALVQARHAYLDDLNRRRLEGQLADATRAEQLRRYAAQVQGRATRLDDPDLARQAQAWGAWVRAEADRIDPLLHPETLTLVEPEEIGPGDLDRFMPRGMSAWAPPN